MLRDEEKKYLEDKCGEIRKLILREIGGLGVGHIGGSLSIVEALVVLYYRHMNINPKDPDMQGRDRFVLSKGHAGPALYAVLADKGYFPLEYLDTLNRPGTCLPSHADMRLTRGVDMTAGALGQGLSCAVGMACGSKLKEDGAHIYAVIGDGESQEGQIWEAAMYAAHRKLDNLIAFTDYNRLQLNGWVEDSCGLAPLAAKWQAFGWETAEIDGHDIAAVDRAVEKAKRGSDRPAMILLHTIKGKGLSSVEKNVLGNHNMTFTEEAYRMAAEELARGC